MTWEKICQEFNSLSSTGVREVKQLKNLYDNLKRNTRKQVATHNVSIYFINFALY